MKQFLNPDEKTLVYAHDPMCGWCWGFRPALDELMSLVPEDVVVLKLLGGLAPDSMEPMPQEMQQYLQQVWRSIQQRIPGTRFNFDFWTDCKPRRSTYPACRAVIAARKQGADWDDVMTKAIQEAYYLSARNPSDNETLISIAGEIGLDPALFERDLVSESTDSELAGEIDFSRQLGIQGFPSLAFISDGQLRRIAVNPLDAQSMVDAIIQQ